MGRKPIVAPGIGERISSLYDGRERADFAKELEFPDATLGAYVRGVNAPSSEFLVTLRDRVGVDINWLLTGEAELPVSASKFAVPVYDIQPTAGGGGMELVPIKKAHISFNEDWFEKFAPPGAKLGALMINGDSMIPTLWPGDLIVINMNEEHISLALGNGGIFIFYHGGDFKVKRLQPSLFDGTMRVISDNERYETEVIPKDIVDSEFGIQGYVIWNGGPPR